MQFSTQQRRNDFTATCRLLVCCAIWTSIATANAADRPGTLPVIPDVGEPFDVKKFCAVSVPYGQNAFIAYRHAAASKVGEGEIVNRPNWATRAQWNAYFLSLNQTLEQGWRFADKNVRRWLETNETALEAWQRGTECADALASPPAEIGVVPPDVDVLRAMFASMAFNQAGRDFARLACLKAARLRAGPHPAGAWMWYRAALRSSAHLGMHNTLTGRLVGSAIYDLAADTSRDWAAQPEIKADDLRRALADVLAVNRMSPPFSETVKGDYLFSANSLDGCIELGVRYIGEYLPYIGYRQRTRRALNLVYANLLSQADRSRWQRSPTRGKLGLFAGDRSLSRSPMVYSDEEIEGRFLAFPPDTKIAHYFVPPDSVFEFRDNEQAWQSGLVLSLALQLHYREHGQFPATLDELVRNGYLTSVPADPFGKGEPFRYRREPNARGEAVLWSVAKDGIDQQGRLDVFRDHSDGKGDRIFKVQAPRQGS
jgi:hypothetical protein